MYLTWNKKIGAITLNIDEKLKIFYNEGIIDIKFNFCSISYTEVLNYLNEIWNVKGTIGVTNFINNDFIYGCFIKSILLKVNFITSTSSVVNNNFWVGSYLLNHVEYGNFWTMFLVRLLHHKLFWLIFSGLIIFLMQLMPKSMFLNLIFDHLYWLLNILGFLLRKLFFSKMLINTRSTGSYLPSNTVHSIIFGIGTFLYLFFGYLFDRFRYKYSVGQNLFFKNKFLNYTILGLIYAITINIGVFSTNSLWYLTNGVSRVPMFILTSFFAIVFAFWWRFLGSLENTSHILRSIAELCAFTSVAWSTYASWSFWLYYVTYPNLYGAVIGFIVHIVFSILAIYNEISTRPNSQLYGVLYLMSFTGAAFSTNGLYAIITTHYNSSWISLLLTLLGFALTIILHPDVYRHLHISERNIIILVILYAMSYYILLFSFVTSTGLLYQLILDVL